jgi:RNA recognition motif-containing protein
MKKLYVGNLPFSATEDQIRALFGKHGTVHSVSLVNDRETGRLRGYGYVEIEDSGFEKALKLDGAALDGRPLKVHAVTDEPVPDEGGGSDSGNAEASGS